MTEHFKRFPKPDAETRRRIDSLLKDCRHQLAETGGVVPAALLLHGDDGIMAVPLVFSSLAEKKRVSFGIRELVKLYDVHTVLSVYEGWTLPPGTTKDVADSLLAKYGEIAKMPQRVEVVHVAIETRAGGIWDAQACIVRKDRSVTLAEPVYRDLSEGQLVGHLAGWFEPERPARDNLGAAGG